MYLSAFAGAINGRRHILPYIFLQEGSVVPPPSFALFCLFFLLHGAYYCCRQYLSKCLTWVTQARTVFVVDTRHGTGRVYLQSRLPLAIKEANKIATSIPFSCIYLEANRTARISSAETIYHILEMENNSCRVTVMQRRSDVISCCCAKK